MSFSQYDSKYHICNSPSVGLIPEPHVLIADDGSELGYAMMSEREQIITNLRIEDEDGSAFWESVDPVDIAGISDLGLFQKNSRHLVSDSFWNL